MDPEQRRECNSRVSRVGYAFAPLLLALAIACPAPQADAQECCELVEDFEVLAPDGEAGDAFGQAVAIHGNLVLVGAPFRDVIGGGSQQGVAYAFRFDGTAWNHEHELIGDLFHTGANAHLGWSVAISLSPAANTDEVALIGAPDDGVQGVFMGGTFTFRNLNGAGWVDLVEPLHPADGATGDGFGRSVSMSGDRAIIGAPGNDENGRNAGAAYAEEFCPNVEGSALWCNEQKLAGSGIGRDSNFGSSVAIDGDSIVVGAPGDGDPATGTAYVFRYEETSGMWEQQQVLVASDGLVGDRFGSAVAISGNVVVVGASFDDDDPVMNSGSVYVFRFGGTNWIEERKLNPCNATEDLQFGKTVSVSDDVILVGQAIQQSELVAHAFRFVDQATGWRLAALLTTTGTSSNDPLGSAVAAGDESAVVGGRLETNMGRAYVFDGFGECECPADTNADGVVDVSDLINVILDWDTDGSNFGGDVNDSGIVDVQDLVQVILAWGPCPGSSAPEPLSLSQVLASAGLDNDDWDHLLAHNDENHRCWMVHYLSGECCPICPTCPPGCPASDPFGGH